MPSEITLALHALIKSGNADKEPTNLTTEAFQVEDIYPIMKHAFSPAAIVTLEKNADSLVYQYNEYLGPKGFDHFYKVESLMRKLGLFKNLDYLQLGWRRNCDVVHFFGSRATKDNIHLAVEKVVSAVNDVADRGYTKAAMMKLGVIKFAIYPPGTMEHEYAVMSYVTLTKAGEAYVAQNLAKVMCAEGGIPERVEDQ